MAPSDDRSIDVTRVITAAPTQVISAFFDASALNAWWDTVRSVTTPRPFGIYAVEWQSTPFRDEVLGTLGGVFYAYWLPPESDPLGPMALEVTCRVQGPATHLRVRQLAIGEAVRWQRYRDLMRVGWDSSLDALKLYLENGGDPALPPMGGTARSAP